MESRNNSFAHGTFNVSPHRRTSSRDVYRVETPRPAKEYGDRVLAEAAGLNQRHFGHNVKYFDGSPNVAHVELYTD